MLHTHISVAYRIPYTLKFKSIYFTRLADRDREETHGNLSLDEHHNYHNGFMEFFKIELKYSEDEELLLFVKLICISSRSDIKEVDDTDYRMKIWI